MDPVSVSIATSFDYAVPREFLRIAYRQGLQLAAQVNHLDEPCELERVSAPGQVEKA